MKKLLFITNGHGEDLVAAELIRELQGNRDGKEQISCLPLVGVGQAVGGLGVKILGARKKLPGGGFSLRNFWFLAQDLLAGLLGTTLGHIRLLRQLKGQFDLVIAIGDIVPIIAALIVKAPFVFVGVNKSAYYKTFGSNYTPWEKLLLQRYALKVFVRDKVTEISLKTHGFKIPTAEYVGNPLMDCVEKMTNDKLQITNEGRIIIGLLPGTREHDVALNLEDFNKIIKEIKKYDQNIEFKVASKENFGSVLAGSTLIIGLSGTGNEQAAGLGKPVVSFFGRGSQYNKKFALAQKELLDGALVLVRDPAALTVAAEVWQLLRQPLERDKMAKIGRERMGQAGAVETIARYIGTALNSHT